MIVSEVAHLIETEAPLSFQEDYDNAGLLVGNPRMEVSGVLLTIDVTEAVVDEAIIHHCNLIIAHHPLIFKGLKKLTGADEVQRCVIKAIKSDIAIYAAHTNLDNVIHGVNGKIADVLSLNNRKVLVPASEVLVKLVTFVPVAQSDIVREALFSAGAGVIGNYDSCSYNSDGYGTFRAGQESTPFVGEINKLHTENEVRIEVILPEYKLNTVLKTLLEVHPYEEPAYDIIALKNSWQQVGAGLIGELPEAIDDKEFLLQLKEKFDVPVIRHTQLLNRKIKRVAICGGSGSFLISEALSQGADIFITGDIKYHEFFQAENRIIVADIGHFESEQFTKLIFYEIITKKMPKFAVRISDIKTNPINYL